jgi:hypothetical protein
LLVFNRAALRQTCRAKGNVDHPNVEAVLIIMTLPGQTVDFLRDCDGGVAMVNHRFSSRSALLVLLLYFPAQTMAQTTTVPSPEPDNPVLALRPPARAAGSGGVH